MCADIVEAQVAEITQMRTWRCDWYGISNYSPEVRSQRPTEEEGCQSGSPSPRKRSPRQA